jgi:hypothetical protein
LQALHVSDVRIVHSTTSSWHVDCSIHCMAGSTWSERHPRLWRNVTRIPRRTGIILLSVLVVLIAARIAAPYVIKSVLNHKLANLPEYRGSIDDVDLSLLDSEFAIDGLRLDQRKGNPKLPFMRVERMEVDYRWDAIFHGEIVADVEIDEPVVNVMPAATQKKDVKDQIKKDEEGKAVTETFKTLLPTKIHHLHIRHGAVRFKDSDAKPPVDLKLTQLNVYISDLSNRPAPASEMPTTGRITGRLQNSGRLRANLRINVFTRYPTFDLDLALRGLDVRELKDFTRAYAKVDLEKGTAAFFTELESKNGRVKGYFKPMFDKIEVLDTSGGDKDDPWYRKAWEGTVGAIEELFEDQSKDRAATKAPISGRFDRPGVDVWSTVVELIVNAFIEALIPGVEHSVGADAKDGKSKDDDGDKKDAADKDKKG